MKVRATACVVALLVLASSLEAQSAPQSAARSAGRLDRDTEARVSRIVDSARASGLPTEPLLGVALEGAQRGAAPDRIVRAVREYAGHLRSARAALGDDATDDEVVSGAGALLSGVRPGALRDLRAARPRESLTVPLVVLADLVARGVPSDTASRAVYVAARAGAKDADFTLLRRYIEQDISAGASPAAATTLRLRNVPGVSPEDLRAPPNLGAPPTRRPN